MTIYVWSISYNSFVKLHGKKIWYGKKFGSHNMTVLNVYLNPCYNEMFYKVNALYCEIYRFKCPLYMIDHEHFS